MQTEFDINDVVVCKTQIIDYIMGKRGAPPLEKVVYELQVKKSGVTTYFLGGASVVEEGQLVSLAKAGQWALDYVADRVAGFQKSQFYKENN